MRFTRLTQMAATPPGQAEPTPPGDGPVQRKEDDRTVVGAVAIGGRQGPYRKSRTLRAGVALLADCCAAVILAAKRVRASRSIRAASHNPYRERGHWA